MTLQTNIVPDKIKTILISLFTVAGVTTSEFKSFEIGKLLSL